VRALLQLVPAKLFLKSQRNVIQVEVAGAPLLAVGRVYLVLVLTPPEGNFAHCPMKGLVFLQVTVVKHGVAPKFAHKLWNGVLLPPAKQGGRCTRTKKEPKPSTAAHQNQCEQKPEAAAQASTAHERD